MITRKQAEEIGQGLFSGFMYSFCNWCFFLGCIGIAFFLLLVQCSKVDSTDKDKWNRSGLRLMTDYGTGVQYLVGPDGRMTPRLNADGTIYVTK